MCIDVVLKNIRFADKGPSGDVPFFGDKVYVPVLNTWKLIVVESVLLGVVLALVSSFL